MLNRREGLDMYGGEMFRVYREKDWEYGPAGARGREGKPLKGFRDLVKADMQDVKGLGGTG